MNFLKKIIKYLNFKTLYINFKYLPLKSAMKLPIFVARDVKISGPGKIFLNVHKIYTGMVKIGFFNMGLLVNEKTQIRIAQNGVLEFKGTASIGKGCRLNILKSAVLSFGDNFSVTSRSEFYCSKEISFGNNCLVSWDCLFMDTDSHQIYYNGVNTNINGSISVGDHVWFCNGVRVLKGVSIANDIVVGAGALVIKDCVENNCLYAGNPAKAKKTDIIWSE